jgi:hypothetical protein
MKTFCNKSYECEYICKNKLTKEERKILTKKNIIIKYVKVDVCLVKNIEGI